MNPTAKDGEESSVLLTYTVPYGKPFVHPTVFFVTTLGLGMLLRFLDHHGLGDSIVLSLVIPVTYTVLYMLFTMLRTVIEMECFMSGLVLKGSRGKSYHIAWDQIRKLRVSRHPYLVSSYLLTDRKRLELMLIPAEVQERLASLVRERRMGADIEIEG